MAQHESRITRDHEEIKRWVEERGGKPATVKGTGSAEEPGVLRIDFPGQGRDEPFEHISWDDFFAKFDESNLAFLYQDKTEDGGTSRFNKFVRADEGDARARTPGRAEQGREGRGAAEESSRKHERRSGKSRR